MRREILLAGLLVASFITPAALLAQEMPEFGAPPEMKELAYLEGTWVSGDFAIRMGPEEPWQSSKMTMEVGYILDGAAQESTLTGSMMGMDFKGVSRVTYHRGSGTWQNTWVDNMSAYQVMSKGEWKDGKMVFKGEDTFEGQHFLYRDTLEKISDGKIRWVYEMSYDKGDTWFTAMKAEYTKQ